MFCQIVIYLDMLEWTSVSFSELGDLLEIEQ